MTSLPHSECDVTWSHSLYHFVKNGSKSEQEMGDIFLILTLSSAVGQRTLLYRSHISQNEMEDFIVRAEPSFVTAGVEVPLSQAQGVSQRHTNQRVSERVLVRVKRMEGASTFGAQRHHSDQHRTLAAVLSL